MSNFWDVKNSLFFFSKLNFPIFIVIKKNWKIFFLLKKMEASSFISNKYYKNKSVMILCLEDNPLEKFLVLRWKLSDNKKCRLQFFFFFLLLLILFILEKCIIWKIFDNRLKIFKGENLLLIEFLGLMGNNMRISWRF